MPPHRSHFARVADGAVRSVIADAAPVVAPDPLEGHVSPSVPYQTEQPLPEVSVLDRAVRSLPGAIAQPPLVPVLVEALLDVGAVRADFDGTSQRLERLADRRELHAVVRRAMRAARNLTDGSRLLDQCGPAATPVYPVCVAAAIGPDDSLHSRLAPLPLSLKAIHISCIGLVCQKGKPQRTAASAHSGRAGPSP